MKDGIDRRDFGDGGSLFPHFLAKSLEKSQEREREARAQEQKAQSESLTDSKTDLLNSRALNEQLPATIGRLKREGYKREFDIDYVVVFLLDIDNFKKLNDSKGHPIGDEALRVIAKRLKEEASERGGQAFRFGGDEFVLMQQGKGNLSSDQIHAILSRIQVKINSDLAKRFPDLDFKLTVSIGHAILSKGEFKDGETPEEMARHLIQTADEKMYADKKTNGTDRGK